MTKIRVEVFPPACFDTYAPDVQEAFVGSCANVEVVPNPEMLRSEGGDLFPDAISIVLDSQTTRTLLEYLLAAYAGKKIIEVVSRFLGKVTDAVGTEFGKDLYASIKRLFGRVTRQHSEEGSSLLQDRLVLRILGRYGEAKWDFRLYLDDRLGKLPGDVAVWASDNVLDVFACRVWPVVAAVIEVVGTEGLVVQVQASAWKSGANWNVHFFRTMEPNEMGLTFNALASFDADGRCTLIGFDENATDRRLTLETDRMLRLKELREMVLRDLEETDLPNKPDAGDGLRRT